MQAKPHRDIPQAELDKLQQLRERLAQVKVSTKDNDDDARGREKGRE